VTDDHMPSHEDRDAESASHPEDVGGFRRPAVPERPALPKPERLNRNILTVAAVVLGLLVIAAVVFMPADRATGGGAAGGPSAPTQTPSFLDQPVPPSAAAGGAPLPRDTVASSAPSRVTPSPYDVGWTGGADAASTVPVAPSGRARAADPAEDARADAFRAALEAPLVAPASVSPGPDAAAAADRPVDGRGYPNVEPPGVGAPSPAVWGRHQAFMAEAAGRPSSAIRTSVEQAPGPYALQAGTLIPAVLVTEINSDLPGGVLAQVARDVYDSRTQRTLLVPKGSRLLGTYEHQLASGQNRLLVAWTRVIFPDGRSISLPGLETKDRAGAGGVADRVDRHTTQVFGTAALLSLVGAAVQLSQPNGGYGPLGAYPSPGQVAAGAVGQQLAQVATQMLQRNLDVQPTIRIRQGVPFNVFVAADLTFAAPYREVR
jgi:type IV secretion system protein VirB10